jgi:hypothetical protein
MKFLRCCYFATDFLDIIDSLGQDKLLLKQNSGHASELSLTEAADAIFLDL